MSALPGVNTAYAEELPSIPSSPVAGVFWQPDWRDRYIVAPDEIHNHDKPVFLGVLDGTEQPIDWNPWEGSVGPNPRNVIRYTPGGDDATTLQCFPQAAPLAIDSWNMQNSNGQIQAVGPVPWAAGMVPPIEPPQSLPYHYDLGNQLDSGQAIGPRQVFRSPPSYSDQTAAVYAAGF